MTLPPLPDPAGDPLLIHAWEVLQNARRTHERTTLILQHVRQSMFQRWQLRPKPDPDLDYGDLPPTRQ